MTKTPEQVRVDRARTSVYALYSRLDAALGELSIAIDQLINVKDGGKTKQ